MKHLHHPHGIVNMTTHTTDKTTLRNIVSVPWCCKIFFFCKWNSTTKHINDEKVHSAFWVHPEWFENVSNRPLLHNRMGCKKIFQCFGLFFLWNFCQLARNSNPATWRVFCSSVKAPA